MYRGRHRGRTGRPLGAVALLLLVLSLVAGCSNAPPPPLVPPPPPGTKPSSSSLKPVTVEAVAGVDKLEGGFNPHTLADLSPTSAALSSLMLPSVFRPGPDGQPQLDSTLMESAEVLPNTPKFTVRYKIRKAAGWSDGGPIAAEDFLYLWQQMRSQPGVTNPAGYRVIDNIRSRQGGKTVDVTFSKPYPGWKTLFNNLLPAHLLKDDPRSWSTALDSGYPAAGGPFMIWAIDKQRGEIILQRNDRYWGPPARSDRIVLRVNDQRKQVEQLRNGNSQLAVFNADQGTMAQLRGLGPNFDLRTVPRPAVVQLLLRPSSPQLSDPLVRQAVEAGLDRRALTDAGTGGGPAEQLQTRSQVLAPSQPGYAQTAPPGPAATGADPQRMAKLLRQAGYQKVDGVWSRDGRPLNLVIAAAFDHKGSVKIAQTAARELQQRGVQATAVTPNGDELFGEKGLAANPMTQNGDAADQVDMAVAPRPVGGDPAAMLASAVGCPTQNPDTDQAYPYNPSGFCDEMLQPTITAALTGKMPFPQAAGIVGDQLRAQAVAMPLYQEAQVMASRKDVPGLAPGNGMAGPFSTAADWVGTPSNDDGY